MKAVFITGGKQYQVTENSEIFVEKIEGEVGKEVTFDQVLLVDDKFGNPFVKDAKVVAEIVKQGRQRKIIIIKHLPQKHHTRKQGHRQPYTKLLIKKIIG